MFERFTKEARGVVTAAVELAERRRDGRVGTEHLLLGVARTSTMLDAETLEQELRRLDEDSLRAVGVDPALAEVDPPRHRLRKKRHIPFTRGAKETLKNSLREALATGDNHIEAEHILLALIALPAGDRAMRALDGCGVDPKHLRESLLARRAS